MFTIYVICLQDEWSVSTNINVVLYDTKHWMSYVLLTLDIKNEKIK